MLDADAAPHIRSAEQGAGEADETLPGGAAGACPLVQRHHVFLRHPGLAAVGHQHFGPAGTAAIRSPDYIPQREITDPPCIRCRCRIEVTVLRSAYHLGRGDVGVLLRFVHPHKSEFVGPAVPVVRSLDLTPIAFGVRHLQHRAHQTLRLEGGFVVWLQAQEAG